jgi:phosphoglycolate phosphatase-like HAD superfamily hydrolase
MTKNHLLDAINSKKLIFWDFDGVIKDSVQAKASCFLQLFVDFDPTIRTKILHHHLRNGGMSRFEKIPIYLAMCNIAITENTVNAYLEKVGQLMVDSVVNSDWVPGFLEFLPKISSDTTNIVVSGTPFDELNLILRQLNIHSFFDDVFGSPTSKIAAIRSALSSHHIIPQDCLMIGDSQVDYDAAHSLNLTFFLRRHSTNSCITINPDYVFTDYYV